MFRFFLILLSLFIWSCGSTKPNITTHKKTNRVIKRTITEYPNDKVVYVPDTIYAHDTIVKVVGKVIKMKIRQNKGKIKQVSCESPGGKTTEENIKENIKEDNKTQYINKKDLLLYGALFGAFLMLLLFLILLIKK